MEVVTTTLAGLLGVLAGLLVAQFSHWSSISSYRQAWINALRDDLATFLKDLETLHYAVRDAIEKGEDENTLRARRDARATLFFSYWRIVLRLNRTEALHIELKEKLEALTSRIETKVPDREKLNELTELARRVLKQEWEVTKYGSRGVPWWRGRP